MPMFLSSWMDVSNRSTMKALLATIQTWIQDDKGRYDSNLIYLLAQCILYSHDYLPLQDKATVEKIQMKYVTLLQEYIKFRYGQLEGYRTKFAECLMIVSYVKQTIGFMKELSLSPKLSFAFRQRR